MRSRLQEVQGDIDWCREEGKATAVSSLHRLAVELEEKVAALEADEARALEGLPVDEEQEISALVDDLAALPPQLLDHLVARLQATRHAAEAEG